MRKRLAASLALAACTFVVAGCTSPSEPKSGTSDTSGTNTQTQQDREHTTTTYPSGGRGGGY